MLVGKDHCWWERIMLEAKDHVGGEGSWRWERIMLPVEDSKCFRIMISVHETYVFAQNGSLSVRSQHKSQQTICQLAADLIAPCRDNTKKYNEHFTGRFLIENEINGQWPTGSGTCCSRVRARTISCCSALRCRHYWSRPWPWLWPYYNMCHCPLATAHLFHLHQLVPG